MVKYQTIIFAILISFFLAFSFSPTILELSLSKKLVDKNREFILEHNYYWPDFNLYLSKINQAWEGRLVAVEKYTSEVHTGSLIQIFYLALGWIGRIISLSPNGAYQLGRIILAPLLLIIIARLSTTFFKSYWAVLAFLVTVVSGSFPHIFYDSSGALHIGSFMTWWSTIDNLQRITFIPHILFGQVGSLFLLYKLIIKPANHINIKQFITYTIIGNLVGIVFPPSLMTLYGVLILVIFTDFMKARVLSLDHQPQRGWNWGSGILLIIFTFPSLLYLLIVTQQIPWVALVEAHRRHFMPVPLDQYFLGTGPVILLALGGCISAIGSRAKRLYPLIFWILSSWLLASLFSITHEQSPLRFTQTGVFIPLGILATYFLYKLWIIIRSFSLPVKKFLSISYVLCSMFYVLFNLYMMLVSYLWQETFIKQRVGASVPLVPYPPQTTYPLSSWMDGIRFLKYNTDHENVVIAAITAANFIPAYAGNYVYFGQTNTVEYERKQTQVEDFFKGKLSPNTAERILKDGRVSLVFYSAQEKELSGKEDLAVLYSFLKPIYHTTSVTIYQVLF